MKGLPGTNPRVSLLGEDEAKRDLMFSVECMRIMGFSTHNINYNKEKNHE